MFSADVAYLAHSTMSLILSNMNYKVEEPRIKRNAKQRGTYHWFSGFFIEFASNIYTPKCDFVYPLFPAQI